MHQSRCATSSSCSFFSCTTILSISSRTFEKESRRAWVASNARPGECERPAASASTEAARPLRARSCAELPLLEVWRKAAFMVLSRTLRALSSSRILTVPSTALISASRLLTRASNSAPLSLHFCLRVARKARSSSSCFLVSSSSLPACTCFSPNSAYSSSSCRTSLLPAAIWSCMAASAPAKRFAVLASSALRPARRPCQGWLILLRRPRSWPRWELWAWKPGTASRDTAPGAPSTKLLSATALGPRSGPARARTRAPRRRRATACTCARFGFAVLRTPTAAAADLMASLRRASSASNSSFFFFRSSVPFFSAAKAWSTSCCVASRLVLISTILADPLSMLAFS
mmetsp:Transcript_21892/g.69098  ORF Transcript_21892/g.69098 Transcript_21892/m.69098 type:complete len:345 (+) Transcript_21892:814-1848(+)